MAEHRRRQPPEDPYYNFLCPAGRENFDRLVLAEERTMADNHSKDAKYRRFRRYALEFIEKHYTPTNFDALIPYMAMTFVDRIHFDGKIPEVVDSSGDNINLFLVCCLIISWKLRTKRFVLANFLNDQQLNNISVDNVIDMESRICRKLDWRLRTVTPFWFMDFFAPYLIFPSKPSKTLRPVYKLIVKAQCGIAFTEFRPSVIAASALQIVAAYLLPDQVEDFQKFVTSEFPTPMKDQVHRCITMLEKLYDGPTVSIDPAPDDTGGASSSAAPRRSDPIPIPQQTHRAGKEPTTSGHEGWAFRDCEDEPEAGTRATTDDQEKEGGGEEIQPVPEAGLVPGVGEVNEGDGGEIHPEPEAGVVPFIQSGDNTGVGEVREGDGGEIHPEPEAGFGRFFQDGDNTDDLMNFRLGWMETITVVDNNNLEEGDDGYFFALLSGKFCGCCCKIL